MKYPNILAAFYEEVWALSPAKWQEINAFLLLKAAGGDVPPEEVQAMARPAAGVQRFGKVAVLPVRGVLSQRAGMLEQASGGVSTEQLGQDLDGLMHDPGVKTVVMSYDTPGGTVSGTPELAAKIRGYRTEGRRVVSMIDATAASAGLWLAAQGSEVVITPSGRAGSVGVIVGHQDISKAEEMMGVKTTLVSSAPYKTEGYPEVPLSEEARGDMQAKVQHFHSMFVADLARGRRLDVETVEKKFGGGRMLTARAAVDAGMADRIMSAERLLAELAGTTPRAVAAARARAVGLDA